MSKNHIFNNRFPCFNVLRANYNNNQELNKDFQNRYLDEPGHKQENLNSYSAFCFRSFSGIHKSKVFMQACLTRKLLFLSVS